LCSPVFFFKNNILKDSVVFEGPKSGVRFRMFSQSRSTSLPAVVHVLFAVLQHALALSPGALWNSVQVHEGSRWEDECRVGGRQDAGAAPVTGDG